MRWQRMAEKWNLTIRASFLIALCANPSISAAERSVSNKSVLRFDAGPKDAACEARATALDLKSVYASKIGFGWTHAPEREFTRRELSRSRTAFTIDGVAGSQVGFRADVAPGLWYLTLWLDAEHSAETAPRVIIQGAERQLNWQTFAPEEEPDQKPQKTFRVFQGTAAVAADGLTFEITGNQDEVRLLGFSLIRQVNETTREHRQLLVQLESAVRYQSKDSLSSLLKEVDGLLCRDPNDAFAALWRERLELFSAAERLSSMRGWEWADKETGLGMFDRLHQAVMLLDALLSADPAEDNPLVERALFLRGRLLYWLGKERSGPKEIAGGNRDLQKLYEQHPDNDLLAMYLGKRIDLRDGCDCLEAAREAPAWSTAQLEALCRLRQISHWWVARQAANGEFGGKFGDDVELLRWWAPLVLSGDETAQQGWQRLADGVWRSEHVHEGYARELRDVEHAAEFVSDTAPLLVMFSDDPRYEQRLACSARHFDRLWTGTTANGHRFFRSAWFSSTAVAADEPRGRDVEYNTRAARGIRYLAWRRPNAELEMLLHQWSAAWVSAAMRTDKGKPRGIIPPSVRFADEAINGDEPNWHQANMFWDYYDWEFYAGSLMLDQLLFTYMLTHDEDLLQPMFLALELISSEEADQTGTREDATTAGSRAWAADKLMRSSFFWSVVEQWRFLTNDTRWDELIVRHGTAYGRYRITGDERHLVEGLNRILNAVRYNTPLMTSEAIHTDRIYAPGWEHLKAMLTGDGMPENSSPYFAASWEKTDDKFTALVSRATPDGLEFQLFSHSPQQRSIVMRLWQLTPGEYQLRCEPQGRQARERTIRVEAPGERISIQLPSRRLLRITVRQVPST